MLTRRVLVTSVALALLSVPALAQGGPSAQPAPAITAPAKPTTTGTVPTVGGGCTWSSVIPVPAGVNVCCSKLARASHAGGVA